MEVLEVVLVALASCMLVSWWFEGAICRGTRYYFQLRKERSWVARLVCCRYALGCSLVVLLGGLCWFLPAQFTSLLRAFLYTLAACQLVCWHLQTQKSTP